MSNHLEIIQQLKHLDLSKCPDKEIQYLIEEYGGFIGQPVLLNVGDELLRARLNEKDENGKYKSLICRKELSYVPKENNKRYQRASTPYQTMFYGCPYKTTNHSLHLNNLSVKDACFITSLEVSKILQNKKDDVERITFSKWAVSKQISLAAICFFKNSFPVNSIEFKIKNNFFSSINKYDENEKIKSLLFNEFLAEEFSKEVKKDDHYNYMISGIFSEMMVNIGKAGIFFPSIKLKDSNIKGSNIAISPETVDSSLKLVSSIECILKKTDIIDHYDLINEKIAFIIDDTKEFQYFPVESEEAINAEIEYNNHVLKTVNHVSNL